MKKMLLVVLIVVGFPALSFGQLTEEKLIASAEKVVEAWKNLLSDNVDIVHYAKSGYWAVRRHKLIDGSMGYDIKKTDSIVSPYLLILSFNTFYLGNAKSPNANGLFSSGILKEWYGFKSAEEALRNTKPIDFPLEDKIKGKVIGKAGGVIDLKIHYAYQKGVWVLKGGNRLFQANFEDDMTKDENVHYFKNLFSISVE